ncbi:MAG: FAD-dependent oxidoreductase [Syntrophothermus sp.]|uniref:FAD-dependent oxidoreductase n=1 Tax=Syntrophothermus sp. TaxID=2736299 RepID=UPI002579F058|nr:FAD-dependent oxidoreductase [Syntrophothermus sp.]NSW84256.1 FAD-dependent oxidoreductase [Syntrophothermus sp.]
MVENGTGGVSRREFIKLAGVGGGGLIVGAIAGSQMFPKKEGTTGIPEKWDEEADVVVVGAGGGGLAAAIEAADAGASVMVLEVMESPLFSNTAICGGVVMGANTSFQKKAGIKDSAEEFEKYLAAVGGGFEDPDLRRVWAQKSGETVEWLAALGVNFPVENLYISGNERDYADVTPPVARGHITDAHSGRPIAEVLYKTAQKKNVKFLFKTRGKRLITNSENEVLGVEADQEGKKIFVKAKKGVVLATAGFSRNKELIKNFMPKLLTGGSFGSMHQQGDGIVMGMAIGAKIVNMWIPQAATIGVPTTPEMTPCMVIPIWGKPCIFVSTDGKRHFSEDLYYEFLYEKIAEQPGGFVWAIWDQDVTDLGGEVIAVPAFSDGCVKEIEKGWVKKADTIRELARQINVDPNALEQTVNTYNKYAREGKDQEFGKKVGLGPVQRAPFYAAKTVPATCDTAGGLKINTEGKVLNMDDKVIPRLYATGSTTGGWRGKIYPGSGTAVSFTVTFGRICGKNAAAEKPWA